VSPPKNQEDHNHRELQATHWGTLSIAQSAIMTTRRKHEEDSTRRTKYETQTSSTNHEPTQPPAGEVTTDKRRSNRNQETDSEHTDRKAGRKEAPQQTIETQAEAKREPSAGRGSRQRSHADNQKSKA